MGTRKTIEDNSLTFLPSFLRRYIDKAVASPLIYRLASGAFWSVIGAVFSRAIYLAISVIIARILGQEQFGALGIIQSTISMFQMVAGLGLGMTATKYIAEFQKKDPLKAGGIIVLSQLVAAGAGFVIMLTIILASPWLATHLLAAPSLSGPLRIGGGVILITAIIGAQTGALCGFEAFKSLAWANFLSGVLAVPVVVLGAYFYGVSGAIWGILIGSIFNGLINHLYLLKESKLANVPFALKGIKNDLKWLWKFSLPALLSGVMVALISWLCNIILINKTTNPYSELGILSAANQWYSALLFIPSMVGQAVLPILSEQLNADDHPNSFKTLIYSIKINSIVVLPVVLIGCILSPLIMGLYGESFKHAWPVLCVVLITAGLLAIQAPIGQLIAASGKMWMGFVMNLGWASAFIICTWNLVDYGALGVATSRGFAYILHSIWVMGFIYHFWYKTRRRFINSEI